MYKRVMILSGVVLLSLALTGAALASASVLRGPAIMQESADLPVTGETTTQILSGPESPHFPTNEINAPQTLSEWDAYSINFPRVISDSGQAWMWYDGRGPSGWAIGLATSTDGMTWTKHMGNPVLWPSEPGEWDDTYRGQSAMLLEGGVFKMWYSGGPSEGPWQTGYATSTDGIDWTVMPTPVLPVGDPGSWDEQEANGPTVINDGGTYKMWYHGCDAGYVNCAIGYATSPDGVTWTKHGDNPVLEPGAGEWDDGGILWPQVVKNGASYEMWYSANGQIGRATSPDGEIWTKYAGNPVLDTGWGGGGPGPAYVTRDAGGYHMWLRSGTLETGTDGIGYASSPNGITWTMYPGNPLLRPGTTGLTLDVNYPHDWIWANTTPTMTIVITVSDGGGVKATISGVTDPYGGFGTFNGTWQPETPDIQPGDTVRASTALVSTEVDPVGELSGIANADNNLVTGTVNAPWLAPTVNVQCEVWVEGGAGFELPDIPADGGQFICDFNGIYDIQPNDMVAIAYQEPDGDRVVYPMNASSLQPFLNVNYGHDWIEGNYPPDHTLWFTVTESDGVSVKATAELTSGVVPWWGGQTGFSTNWQTQWSPSQPDILPGDWIFARSDSGHTAEAQIGTIEGELDLGNDTVSGMISAPWFSSMLNANCGVWEPNAPGFDFEIDPAGDTYFCDFASAGWDLLPNHMVGVQYQEPDGDWIINVFESPTPDLNLQKWPAGNGQTAPGSPALFYIYFRNNGDAVATNVILTDTLPAGTSYQGDTNPYPTVTTTQQIVWNVGDIQPNEEVTFLLVLDHTATSGDVLLNQVDISTEYDRNLDDNHAEAEVQVVDGFADLYINKHPEPGDPAPGETFLYVIDVGNSGSVASGLVVLTDTLPAHTQFVSLSNSDQADIWTELVSGPDQLVLQATSLPGQWSDQIRLRLRLDPVVEAGTQLTNTVEIWTDGDANQEDNWFQDTNVWVSDPRVDAYVDKWFDGGQLTPGGFMNYGIHFNNTGNVAAHLRVTDTLPAGLQFVESWLWDGKNNVLRMPDLTQDNLLIWDFGEVEPGQWYNLNFRVDIDSAMDPGETLENCVQVGHYAEGFDPLYRSDCIAETLSEPGTNLRMYKDYQWNDYGQLHYRISLQNIGSVPLPKAWVTDTLPAGTSLADWWPEYHGQVNGSYDPVENQLILEIDPGVDQYINPGDTIWMNVNADLDGELVGVPGLTFTNTVETSAHDDVNPADNTFQVVAHTGPDIYISKWLSAGTPMPGEVITFTVEMGNSQPWPWDSNPEFGSRITETLPDGMEFLRATAAWDPSQEWPPDWQDGNQLAWNWGTMWAGSAWQFDIAVQLTDTLTSDDVLMNTIEIYSTSPDEAEVGYENNEFTLPVPVLYPKFSASKLVSGNPVAGMPVTYTLSAMNTGTMAATGVVVKDTLPDGFTYLDSDGTLTGGEVTWSFASLPLDTTVTGWVAGEVTCTAGTVVTNEDYGVAASDQGAVFLDGTPVDFTVQAPAISAGIQAASTAILEDLPLDFGAAAETDGTALHYAWDFGDGETASGMTASHTYADPGTYEVTLTVTDECGFTASDTVTIEVLSAMRELFLPLIQK